MKIQHRFEKSTLTITDDGFDSPHVWLTVTVEDEEGVGTGMDILLDDLMPMLIAFDTKRSRLNTKEEEV